MKIRGNHENLAGFGRAYRRTKQRYPGLSCAEVVLAIFQETKLEWAFEELRKMTGYSMFTMAGAFWQMRRMGYRIDKQWDPDLRVNFYRVYA